MKINEKLLVKKNENVSGQEVPEKKDLKEPEVEKEHIKENGDDFRWLSKERDFLHDLACSMNNFLPRLLKQDENNLQMIAGCDCKGNCDCKSECDCRSACECRAECVSLCGSKSAVI